MDFFGSLIYLRKLEDMSLSMEFRTSLVISNQVNTIADVPTPRNVRSQVKDTNIPDVIRLAVVDWSTR
jgi:hypothetical protein